MTSTRPAAILIGPMGAGKTSVGRRLARQLGLEFRDTDADVEAMAGKSVSDIFVEDGEPHFRELERQAVARAVAEHTGILALGGGAVMDPATQKLLADHQVVYLRVGLAAAAQRVGMGVSRPLLLGNVRTTMKRILDDRAPTYEQLAKQTIDTDELSIDQVASMISAHLQQAPPVTVEVKTAAPYRVVVGHGVLSQLEPMLPPTAQRIALIYAEPLRHMADQVAAHLTSRELFWIDLPDGEAAKTVTVAQRVWEQLGNAGFTRSDAVVTIGGGATTDMGGFIAATWLRGVPVVHIPTSLLGMVDAAVGGKTGLNTTAGKNLVGAFHEPTGVLCDLSFLESLPSAELLAGMGEVVKCGFISDPEILRLVRDELVAPVRATSAVLPELIIRAIQVKADVVAGDLTEQGGDDEHPGREVLNYGHTLAHAIEKVTNYHVRHGEAVALGMIYAAELAHSAGLLAPEVVAEHRQVLAAVGLPTHWGDADFTDLLAAMHVDKKSRGNTLRFLVITAVGKPQILAAPQPEWLQQAWQRLQPAVAAAGEPGIAGGEPRNDE